MTDVSGRKTDRTDGVFCSAVRVFCPFLIQCALEPAARAWAYCLCRIFAMALMRARIRACSWPAVVK